MPPTYTALPSQRLSLSAPPQNTQGRPLYPPPGPPYLVGHPGPNGGQYHPASAGMSVPQHYYNPWGYGHYPPGPYPHPFPHAGGIQPNPDVPVQVCETQARAKVGQTQVHAEVGQTLVINQLAPAEFQPKKFYPNKQISEGGTSHSI